MSEIYPETVAVPDDPPRDTSTWLGGAMQAACHAYRAEHGWAPLSLAHMGNAERKGWGAVVRVIDQLVGERDMRIEIPEPEPKPATVIVVTEEDGNERRYSADRTISGLFVGLTVFNGEKEVAHYIPGTYKSSREEGATLPGEDSSPFFRQGKKLAIALDALRFVATSENIDGERAARALNEIAELGL